MTETLIYAIAQQKGGVGKTTTINLGVAPQGALAVGLGHTPLAILRTLYDVLRDPCLLLCDIITSTSVGVALASANIDLAAAGIELSSEPGRERIPGEKLTPLAGLYRFIVIECPPPRSACSPSTP
jgi:chromosome partitioning protein